MNHRPAVSLRRLVCLELAACLVFVPVLTHSRAVAQTTTVSPAPPAAVTAAAGAAAGSDEAQPSEERVRQATALISEALTLAEHDPSARVAAVRGAASLIPRLEAGNRRTGLAMQWQRLALSPDVPRTIRNEALAGFFDAAARRDLSFARMTAGALPDPAARAGAFVRMSEAVERMDWLRADEYDGLALSSARHEPNALYRARALTFVADRIATVNPAQREAATREAAVQVRNLGGSFERDYLLATLVGTAAKFDLPYARRLAGEIGNPQLKALATSRVNLSLVSQTTLGVPAADRVTALSKTVTRYDTRAIPVLLQLPAQPAVLASLSRALPPIYPTAPPALDITLLERMWNFVSAAEPSVQRDELQSRLARLMVLHDPWRGRGWGKLLAWKGGRVQVGAFLHDVMVARRSALGAAPLQDLAARNINRALLQARSLPTPDRVAALLMIAGQVLG